MKKFPMNRFFQGLTFFIGLSLSTQSVLADENSPKPLPIQQAVITTALGVIEIELYSEKAPVSVANFIHYIEAGAFNQGRFYRVVRLDNDNGSPKIEVIQGGANIEIQTLHQYNLKPPN